MKKTNWAFQSMDHNDNTYIAAQHYGLEKYFDNYDKSVIFNAKYDNCIIHFKKITSFVT